MICPLYALISLEEEEKIGKEVLQEVSKNLTLINDPEAIAYVNLLGETLARRGITFSPFKFRFYIIKDKTFNAFSVPGGYIFLNTGLFDFLESEDELAGIMAHEMSHNLARHVAKRIENIKRMQIATTAATLAAIFLGGGEAGQIVGITGTALAQTKLLAYSRMDEEEADRMGFEIVTKAGFNPEAMVRIFQKLSRESTFSIELNYRYLLTHPLPPERMNYLQNLSEKLIPYSKGDTYALSNDPVYFKRLKKRIIAYEEEPSDLILTLKNRLSEDRDPWLKYELALALMQGRFFVEAENYMKEAITELPPKPYFELDLAELYYQRGLYDKARNILKRLEFTGEGLAKILELKRKYLLARALSELGDLKGSYSLFKELEEENLLRQDPYFYYYFGLLCARLDNLGESHFYFGKYYENRGDFKTALYHYKKSLPFLKKNSKMYLEAKSKVEAGEKGARN
ncbi:MAG: M48 family metalloprotease [Caldimicrobium sp.]